MDYKQWTGLLGRSTEDPGVRQAVAEAGVTKNLKVDKDDTDVRADIKGEGITLVFADEAFLRNRNDLSIGETPPILSEIIMILQHPKVTTYKGALPFGLNRNDSQIALRTRFGSPIETNAEFRWDRWKIENLLLTATYTSDQQSVNRLIVSLPAAK